MLTLTEKAAQNVIALLQKNGKAEGFLRVRVTPGGCSGLSYEFELADRSEPGDVLCEAYGAKVLVDPQTSFFIRGSQLDYAQNLMKSGFVVKNPNAASSCSCGNSFCA